MTSNAPKIANESFSLKFHVMAVAATFSKCTKRLNLQTNFFKGYFEH